MKKIAKKFLIVFMLFFALIGAGGTVAFAMNYIQWNGTADYEQTITNLDLILERGRELITERDESKKIVEDQRTVIENQKTIIKNKETTITELQEQNQDSSQLINDLQTSLAESITNTNLENGARKKFDSLSTGMNNLAELLGLEERVSGDMGNTKSDDQLKQAEEDMKNVKEKSGTVLDELSE